MQASTVSITLTVGLRSKLSRSGPQMHNSSHKVERARLVVILALAVAKSD